MSSTRFSTAGRASAARRPGRVWALRAALVVALCVVVLAIAPGSAPAGTYTIESCTNGSIAGWAPFYHGSYSGWGNSCGLAGGAMNAASSSHPGSSAGWTFSAPAGTEIAAFRLTRAYRLTANQPFGTGVVTVVSGPGSGFYDSRANFGGAVGAGPEVVSAGGLRGQTTLTARVECGGGSWCTGESVLQVTGTSIDLRDETPPTLAGVGGSLLAPGALKGVRSLSYTAHDRGGGVRGVQLLADGAVVAARGPECSFALPVPCPPADTGTLALDTTRLAEGEHEVTLVVADATLVNRAVHGPVLITVDNVPPPAATSSPRITGGATLHTDDGIWSGANLVFERRWQRFEDGAWQDVASGSVYTPGADDEGHRLRVRVRASNTEGTGEAFSEPTARVPAATDPPPTPTPTATPTPASPPAPVTVAGFPTPVPAAPASTGSLSAAFAATGRTTITLRWGERRKVTGVLTGNAARPLAGERIAITSTLRAGNAVALPLGHVVTDGDGRFSFLPPAGASRTLRLTRGDSSATLAIHVVPRVTARITASGRIEGRVSGAPPGVAKRVQLQALRGRVWRTFATTRLRPTGGTFAHRPRTLPRRVRARVLAEPGWPFVTGTSAPTRRM